MFRFKLQRVKHFMDKKFYFAVKRVSILGSFYSVLNAFIIIFLDLTIYRKTKCT